MHRSNRQTPCSVVAVADGRRVGGEKVLERRLDLVEQRLTELRVAEARRVQVVVQVAVADRTVRSTHKHLIHTMPFIPY